MKNLKGIKKIAKLLIQEGEGLKPISQARVKEHNKDDDSKKEKI